MLLLTFQTFADAENQLLVLLWVAFALAIFIMPLGSTVHSRISKDMVKRPTGAAQAPGTPPFGPTQKSPKRQYTE